MCLLCQEGKSTCCVFCELNRFRDKKQHKLKQAKILVKMQKHTSDREMCLVPLFDSRELACRSFFRIS
jgi:hypothetical protein